jgi:hypothetical protein
MTPKQKREHTWRGAKIRSFVTGDYLSWSEFHATLTEQGGCCAICKRSEPNHPRGWAADHDHVSDYFRGALCQECNSVLGQYEKRVARGEPLWTGSSFQRYLDAHQGRVASHILAGVA